MASNYVVSGPIGQLLRESLSDMWRHVIENDPDPVTTGIVLDSSRVEMTLGRGSISGAKNGSTQFSAQHPLVFGRAGLLQYQNINNLLGNDTPPRLAKSVVYPNATNVPQRQAEWLTIPLKWLVGNLTIDRIQWLALTSGKPVEDFLADWLRDPIELVRVQMTTDFFGDGTGKVGTISVAGTGGAGGDWANTATEQTLTVSSTLRSLWRGQRVYIGNGGAKLFGQASAGDGNEVAFTITKVFSYAGSGLKKVNVVPDANLTETVAVGDTLHLVGAWNGSTGKYGVQGLENFILDAAAGADINIHGLNVYTHSGTVWNYPELLSYVDSNSGTLRNPTPVLFEKAADEINDRGFEAPTRWIMPRNVRSLYYLNEGTYKVYNTDLGSGVQRGADGGISGNPSITTEKGTVEAIVSAYCPKNTAYGIRPDAFVRYAPKGIDSIQFIAQSELLGNNGSPFFMSVDTTTGGRTTVYEAPFDTFCEWGCLAPQSLAKIADLKGLTDVI